MSCPDCSVEVDDVDMGFSPPRTTYVIRPCNPHTHAKELLEALKKAHDTITSFHKFHIGDSCDICALIKKCEEK